MSVSLVMEGGGMRGAYTAGVLQVLADHGIRFDAVYGVSAGACNALSWISGQVDRNREIFNSFVPTHQYLSRRNLISTGNLFGYDYIFGRLFHEQLPFDYETFYRSPVRFRVGVTDVDTGKPFFFEKEDLDDRMDVIRASSALPFVSRMVEIRGRRYLDGGVAMPIPLEQAVQDGYDRHVVILTRDASYVRPDKPDYPRRLLQTHFRRYLALVRAMLERPKVYREELAYCRQMQEQGKAYLIRPSVPVQVARCERNPEKILPYYELGKLDCQEQMPEILAFVNGPGENEKDNTAEKVPVYAGEREEVCRT